jgi:hypothetical protein
MSTECVFLGFSHLHKGFKCLYNSTGRGYVSRDVVFDKNVFPFASLHPNIGARLKAETSLLPSGLIDLSIINPDGACIVDTTESSNPIVPVPVESTQVKNPGETQSSEHKISVQR